MSCKTKIIRARGYITTSYKNETGGRLCARLYGVYRAIRDRIFNERHKSYHRYGGRGISIYDPWMNYSTFRIWAISSGYRKGLTIDRIDNDGNYEPTNCRWITRQENARKATTIDRSMKGVGHNNAILTDLVVRQMRTLYKTGLSTAEIGRRFNIGQAHAWSICNRKRWTHI